MTRERLRIIAACGIPGLLLGALVGLAAAMVGGVAGLMVGIVGVVLIGLLGPRFLVRYVVPGRVRATLRRLVDLAELPPASARPIDLPLAERIAGAINARNWDELAEHTDPKLVLIHPESRRRYGRKHFLRAARMSAEAYPDLCMLVEEVVADPASPDVAWVRFQETGRPRVGAPLRASWWERWTVGPGGQALRELELGRAVQVD